MSFPILFFWHSCHMLLATFPLLLLAYQTRTFRLSFLAVAKTAVCCCKEYSLLKARKELRTLHDARLSFVPLQYACISSPRFGKNGSSPRSYRQYSAPHIIYFFISFLFTTIFPYICNNFHYY